MEYGYIRVSTKGQKEDRQLIAMQEFGIRLENLYIDKQSGKDFQRPAYKKMVKKLKKNDRLVIKSIDRLGRNYQEIIEQWRIITREKQVEIIVLDMPLLNTTENECDLTGLFISDLVLQILSYVAQCESENIKRRQREGIAAAKKKGVRFGRPKIEKPNNFLQVHSLYTNKQISAIEASQSLSVSVSTFARWVREL